MHVTPIRTRAVRPTDRGLTQFLDQYIKRLPERSILAITSKVAAILEGAVVPMVDAKGKSIDKKKLIAQEADLWLPVSPRARWKVTLTVKGGILAATSGIDESNGDGFYILWPRDPQRTVNQVRKHLMRKFRRKELGVILTDSTSRPMRRGLFGIAIAHSGFRGLVNYIGTPDIYGRRMKMTKANIMEGLATAAVLTMGEGAERKPLAVLTDLPVQVRFQKGNPSRAELEDIRIDLQDDLYAPVLTRARWRKGGGGLRATTDKRETGKRRTKSSNKKTPRK